jgi:hypothetical protein
MFRRKKNDASFSRDRSTKLSSSARDRRPTHEISSPDSAKGLLAGTEDFEEISLDSPEKRCLRRALSDEGTKLFLDAHSDEAPTKVNAATYMTASAELKVDRNRIVGLSAAPKLGPIQSNPPPKVVKKRSSFFKLGEVKEWKKNFTTLKRGVKSQTSSAIREIRPITQETGKPYAVTFTINDGPFGFLYSQSNDDDFAIQFDHFNIGEGTALEQVGGVLHPLFVLTHINKVSQKRLPFKEVWSSLAFASRPVELTFAFSAQNPCIAIDSY